MNEKTRGKAGRISALAVSIMLLSAFAAYGVEKNLPKPGPRDKCPVCGMFVAPFPNWIAVVAFKDGSHSFFDGPKDLFKYLKDQKQYDPTHKAGHVGSIFVTDYYAVSLIDARAAWYVAGSDVAGPMGNELVPLATESDARSFLKDHKGKKILRFPDITPEVIKGLD
jgi:copper chaperone NosL